MKPVSRRTLLAPVLALTVAGCGEQQALAVGAVTNRAFLEGMRMAFEGLDPRDLPALDTVFLSETSTESLPALTAAETLLATPGLVAVVGHSNSSASLAASQVYNQAGVVQIAPTVTAPLYSEAGAFSFRMVPSDVVQGQVLATLLMDSLPPGSRVAVANVHDDYGRGLRTQFLARLDPNRILVALDMPFPEIQWDESQKLQFLESLAAARPDALVWLGRWQLLDAIIPEIRTHHGPIPIFGGDALAPAEVRDSLAHGWAGVRYLDFLDLEATPELRAFQARFIQRYGQPAGAAEVLTHDAMAVVLESLRQGARTGAEVQAFLLSLDRGRPPFSGLSGPVSFQENGDANRPFVLKIMSPRTSP